MKITRKQLRKMILKEFKVMDVDTPKRFDFGSGAGGNLPPIWTPRRRGGGGGEDPQDFSNNNPGRCEFGNPHYDQIYEDIFQTFEPWVIENYGSPDNYFDFILTLINPSTKTDSYEGDTFSMEDLGVRDNPSHIDRDKNEFFQILMTSICDYVCIYNIPNPTVVYSDPSEAIIFNKYDHM